MVEDFRGGLAIPIGQKRGQGANLRRRAGSKVADYPPGWMRNKNGRD